MNAVSTIACGGADVRAVLSGDRPCPERRTVAIVVPDVSLGHGVPAVASFLYQGLRASGRYRPCLISLATSSSDSESVRLRAPATWFRGARVRTASWQGLPYIHVGAIWVELEFQRYMPRKLLTRLLQGADLIQVVAGTPAWAHVVPKMRVPIVLHVASLITVERAARLSAERGWRRGWLKVMTKINRFFEARALRRVDAVLVENRWMYDAMRRLAPNALVRFAPPGIDTDFFSPPSSYARNGYILSVGRFSDPRKNVRLLFDAYAKLVRRETQVPDLVLVGNEPARGDKEYMLKLGIGAKVHLYENVSAEELRRLYRGARIFVLSSDEEGLGLVVLEAMACGLPVVATDCGGPRTSVVDGVTGILVPVRDADALASAMMRLVTDPALAQRMGEAGRTRVVEHFSVEVATARFIEVYDLLLGGKMRNQGGVKGRIQ